MNELLLEKSSDLAEEITEYIVNNFTNCRLWIEDESGDSYYSDEAQDIFNIVYDMVYNANMKEEN